MAFALFLVACSESEETARAKPDPVHFEPGDECHVCGMTITRFPGPKGEAIAGKQEQVRKFCSTRDMFSWLFQPENVNRDHVLYVHDMAQTDWEHPDDTALIDAREAVFVVGSERTGAMGPTLASFADRTDAEGFAGEHGGEVLAFSEVRMEHLTMSGAGHSM
nr:nitrous oxide reductase accessory protein NosL [Marinobacter zhanjiangensis]